MSLTLDDSTQATHPGAIRISRRKFLEYNSVSGFSKMYYSIILLVPKRFILRLFKSDQIVYNWIHTCEQFEFGCVNPSVIINKEKGLIATFTNLTSFGDEPTPVIKISVEKLYLIENIALKNGQRISTVALYERDEDDIEADAWKDFFPIVPNCLTNDIAECNNSMEKLNQAAWKCLELGLKQVTSKETPGLYYVDLDKYLVKSS
jgi:hypothetical protein